MFGEYPDDIDWSDPIDRGHPLAACLSMYWPGAGDVPLISSGSAGALLAVGHDGVVGLTGLSGSGTSDYPGADHTRSGTRLNFRSIATTAGVRIATPTAASTDTQTFGAFFTSGAQSSYYNLISNHVGSTFLLASGGDSGASITGSWPGSSTFNDTTGLTIPTTGEVCFAAFVVATGFRRTYLFTPSTPGGSYYDNSGTTNTATAVTTWRIGSQNGFGRAWNGCVWGAFASKLKWEQSWLSAYYQNAALFLRRTSRRSMVSVPTATAKPWLYTPHSARLVA